MALGGDLNGFQNNPTFQDPWERAIFEAISKDTNQTASEQSNLGLHCLTKSLLNQFSRCLIVIGALRVNRESDFI